MATFRGYADQRHVAVLALRDERQRNREVATDLRTLGESASGISVLISAGLKHQDQGRSSSSSSSGARPADCDSSASDSRDGVAATGRGAILDTAGDAGLLVPPPCRSNFSAAAAASCASGSLRNIPGGRTINNIDTTAAAEEEETAEELRVAAGTQAAAVREEAPPVLLPQAAENGDACSSSAAVVNRNHDAPSAEEGGAHRDLFSEVAEERRSIEAIRGALADARAELDRRAEALKVERDAKRLVEGRVRDAEGVARAAEERAAAAEAAGTRWKGRVSVLERNVDYLQSQQRGLR